MGFSTARIEASSGASDALGHGELFYLGLESADPSDRQARARRRGLRETWLSGEVGSGLGLYGRRRTHALQLRAAASMPWLQASSSHCIHEYYLPGRDARMRTPVRSLS